MGNYKFVFNTKEQCDTFSNYVDEEELWSKTENDTTLIVCSIFESTAKLLYDIANKIKNGGCVYEN